MSVNTVDDIVAGLAAKQTRNIIKNFTAAKGAGAFESAWLATGIPGAGAAPPAYTAGSGYTADKSTVGAIAYTNGAVKNWLARMLLLSNSQGSLILADRLWSCSGMGFAASTYAVTTPGSLPARITDNGLGCELWVEQFAAAGSASGTLTANYLDSAGASKTGVIAAVVSAPVIGQMQPIPQANNLGVKQLTSLVNSATWTSGSFGATILKRIAEVEIIQANAGRILDWISLGLPALTDDMCLMLMFLANSAASPVVIGRLDIIDK
jgi:hypothetical protein